jgi:hypothetical protein
VDLTKNVKMPPWGIIRRIDASNFDPGTAYMAVDYHLVDNRAPFLFKTSDFGQTWARLDANGRGLWILRDLSPLEQSDTLDAQADLQL